MRVWTFDIQGGEAFTLSLPRHPTCDHKGKHTVWHLCGTEKAKEAAETLMLEHGCQVVVYMQGQDSMQAALRSGVADVGEDTFDYTTLDEGIRHTVQVLRQHGFETCDSGDGRKAEQMEGALPVPHVFIQVEPASNLIPECLRLQEVLENYGVAPSQATIQGTFDPCNRIAIIAVMDAVIPEVSHANL